MSETKRWLIGLLVTAGIGTTGVYLKLRKTSPAPPVPTEIKIVLEPARFVTGQNGASVATWIPSVVVPNPQKGAEAPAAPVTPLPQGTLAAPVTPPPQGTPVMPVTPPPEGTAAMPVTPPPEGTAAMPVTPTPLAAPAALVAPKTTLVKRAGKKASKTEAAEEKAQRRAKERAERKAKRKAERKAKKKAERKAKKKARKLAKQK